MEKYVIKIGGMSCPHCVKAVESALCQLPGVKSVKIDLARQQADVMADAGVFDSREAEQAINQQGYEYLGIDSPASH